MLDLEPIKRRAGIGAPTPEHDCSNQSNGCERCEREAQDSAADVPALVAEVERLRAAIEGAERNGASWLNECDRRGKEIAGLAMDNSTLRAALDAATEVVDAARAWRIRYWNMVPINHEASAEARLNLSEAVRVYDARRAAEQGKTQ